jgi:hypothetical protein
MSITLDGTNGITTPDVEVDSIGTSTSTAVTVRTNGAERLRVDSAGNVGIGTTAPAGTGVSLNVRGTSQASSVVAESLDGANHLTMYSGIGGTDVPSVVFGTTGMRFGTGPKTTSTYTERARIDASGNFLVGTTSAAGRLTVYADSGVGQRIEVFQIAPTVMEFRNSQGSGGSITIASGGGTSFNTSSDYRLKEDVQPMVGASDRLMALKPVNFAWKVDGSRVDGFLAHEAQEVVPECVTGEKDAVDDEGNPQYQGIDQSKIVPLLVAALQEALTKIEALEARVAALETNA